MGRLMIVEPMPIVAVAASRGTGADNLATRNPKEVWADNATGTVASIYADLGEVRQIDTIMLGHVTPPGADATWLINGGLAAQDETNVLAATPLRAPDVAGRFPATSHALWHGEPFSARYVSIGLMQNSGLPLKAGVLVIGKAFIPALGKEWGSGRRPIDMGSATPQPSGGFAIVEGARKSAFKWTFGDLSIGEADYLDTIAEELGTTRCGLVVEDPDPTPGLVRRIHYGLFRWREYERRNRRQTRWELEIEQWK